MNTHQIPEIPQEWDFYLCRIEDKPASIRLNLALRNVAPLEDFPFQASFFVKMQNPDENGMSSNEEYPILCDIEDAIHETTEAMGVINVGVIKSDGALEICMFAQNVDNLEDTCRSVLAEKFPEYLSKFSIQEDPEWDFYFNFLFPDQYYFQQMMNRRVVYQLEQQGDQLETPREIDHWLYFASEEECNKYVKEVENQGYKIVSKDKIENENTPYQLHISRSDAPSEIDEAVWQLLDILKHFDAYYDGWGCNVMK